MVNDDPQGHLVVQESGASEKIRRLKQKLSDVYQACVTGQPPPPDPLEGISTVSLATNPRSL